MNKHLEDIKHIRQMMERSSKFLSLSGLSGVFSGITALVGVYLGSWYYQHQKTLPEYFIEIDKQLYIFFTALAILVISIAGSIVFSWMKIKKDKSKINFSVLRNTLYSICVPLITGGIVTIHFLFRGEYETAAACTLIFYGLSLVSASKYTFTEVQYLGLFEILLGMTVMLTGRYALWAWCIGFGICHIAYGTYMYFTYDLKKND